MIIKHWKDLTSEEQNAIRKMENEAQISEATRPLTLSEVQALTIRGTINSLDIPDATASRMVAYFPELTGDGSLIKAGTKINWYGQLKKASVDLWDTETNTPDAAPTLWADIAYRDGIRIIPDVIPATLAWMNGELGWRDGHVYKSGMDGNVYLPGTVGAPWEQLD